MPGRKARPGSGGTPRKAARSSQRTPPSRPRAAPSAVTAAAAAEAAAAAAAAAEESWRRQWNRRTLEEDKPAAERCLEQLVFGDVEEDEDALLRRLRTSRVRAACLLSGHTLGTGARREARHRGGAWGTCGGERSGGRDRRPRAPRGAGALSASGSGLASLVRAVTQSLSAPKGQPQFASCWPLLHLSEVVCKPEPGNLGF